MLKVFWRFLSDMCLALGAEHLAFKFLLMSIETINVTAPTINVSNTPHVAMSKGPFDLKVIYEDKELIKELGDLHVNDVMIPKNTHDIN